VDPPDPVNAQLRRLPPVERLVELAARAGGLERWSLLAAARSELAEARERMLAGEAIESSADGLGARVERRARRLQRPFPRRVLNATGVVLHTNLGRAPLSGEAAEALRAAAQGYSDLEFDLEHGVRGSRAEHVAELLCALSGAEAALVVNNNAAAVLLAVDTLAAGREVVISRGELVEIGGSFRVPEILGHGRAQMREVGTTNRTHLRDYEAVLGERTGLLLKVHRSNFELRGFASEVGVRELAALGARAGAPVVVDRGSGTLVDLRPHGLPEPPAQEALREGADLVLFSGDKLLGGPQAGIALGRLGPIERMRRSPLARALRCDKLQLAALAWTLRALLRDDAFLRIPTLRMLTEPAERLQARAAALFELARGAGYDKVQVLREPSRVGGGSLPELELPSHVVRIDPDHGAEALARALRAANPALVARIREGALLLDVRTLAPEEIELAGAALREARSSRSGGGSAGAID
jgi:L-seryl-tRNA(Ser) seleniumtransferase